MSAPAGQAARLQVWCRGVLQGVGARPALQRLASARRLSGTLHNRFGGLEIDLCGLQAALQDFLAALPAALPDAARLEQLEAHWLDPPHPPWPQGVRIAAAPAVPLGPALVAPGLSADRAPCPRCLAELDDPASRRHRYPFISCCACGPRFSLATALPFCRAHTTLAAFPPCPACAEEFSNPADRRFHAETISCPICGPRLSLLDVAGLPLAGGEAALDAAARLLLDGQILALQGVGGFQLLVDACQRQAVERLRQRKHRPAKPFALLLADPWQLEEELHCSAAEERLLRHPAAPILLLRRRFVGGDGRWEPVAPGSPSLGVMLPASALHRLLARGVGRPLVATSGNRSGEPLCISPGEAVQRLAGIADAFLVHDLPIARPLDDSLVQLIDGRPALLRRARGFVPEALPWQSPEGPSDSSPEWAGALLALGGDLKAAPALVMGDRIWLGPHLGDLADAAVQCRWQDALQAQLSFPAMAVTSLACDAHPGYLSHQLARPLADRHGIPLAPVPHHLAHGLAVLAEHGRQPPLLVVACDGLGLAAAGARPGPPPGQERLWGGELLLIHGLGDGGLRWQRLAALRPFPLPGGERASREPRRCGLGLLAAAGAWALAQPGAAFTIEAFSARERDVLLQAMAGGCNAPLTSSLGRFLDGVSSLLGLAQRLSYEGEGGLRWQGAAARGQLAQDRRAERSTALEPWPFPLMGCSPQDFCAPPLGRWDWEPLLRALLADRAAGGCPQRAAWQVERALVEGIVQGAAAAAAWSGCRQVALAGGCFQNRSLLEGCLRGLRQRAIEPLWGEQVPCHDGGLALGQAWATQAARSGP